MSVSCERVEDASWSDHCGVVVPIPKPPREEFQRNSDCEPAAPKRTVEEAKKLLEKRTGEVVAVVIAPK